MGVKSFYTILLGASAIAVAIVLYLLVYPLYGQYFPKCLFYSFTGLHCPGCGSQRAIAALVHGDIVAALHNNLLVIIALPFLLYSFIYYVRTKQETSNRNTIFYSPVFVKLVLVTVVLFAIARNIPIYPFTLLMPLS